MRRTFPFSSGSLPILLFLFFFSSLLHAQFHTQIVGTPAAANILIGHAENIKSVLFNKKPIPFDKEGYFIFGFDWKAKGSYTLKILFRDRKTESVVYDIKSAEYDKQRISGLQKNMVTPSKKEKKRIGAEYRTLAAEKKKLLSGKNAFFKSGFIVPVDSFEISGTFGSTRVLNGVKKSAHFGVDYSTAEGKPVKAAGDGIVLVAKKNYYYNGTFIMIDHGFGLITNYLHLSRLFVKRGDKVSKGDIIGEVGSTGRATGPHLHFGVQLNNMQIDPQSLLRLSTGN